MKVNYFLDEGAYAPQKAHGFDAGFDLRTPIDVTVNGGTPAIVDTGVHIELPQGYCGLLVSKSGLNVRLGIHGTGLIDAGYTGSIVARLDSHDAMKPHKFFKGDKIIQLILLPVPDVELNEVGSIEEFVKSARGSNGFGSTGR